MKKKLMIVILILILIVYIIARGSYAVEDTYTREDLQNMVVSTALSYYYKNSYSDYEQKSMDIKSTVAWRKFRNSPETVSRINYYMTDCSSFATSVYLHSLGYDFSSYYDLLNASRYYTNYYDGTLIENINSVALFQDRYLKYGKGPSTNLFSTIANNELKKQAGTINSGIEYINNDSTSEAVYYYKTKVRTTITSANNVENSTCNTRLYGETCEEQDQIKNNIKNLLEPGDLLIYRRQKGTKEIKANGDIKLKSDSNLGHVVVFVGKSLNDSDQYGFIHSVGGDYDFESNPIDINEDAYSVRYDTWDNFFYKYLFIDSETEDEYAASTNFSIIRPINKFCNGDTCTITKDKILSLNFKENYDEKIENTIARNELSRMRIEQYEFKGETTNKELVNKYNSVNIGDVLSYRLVLQNKSKMSYCNYSYYTSEAKCVENNRQWKTADKPFDYRFTITAKVPENAEFVSCGKNCTYNSDTNTLVWTNVYFPSTTTTEHSYTYSIRVLSGNKVINEGMTITTEEGHHLKMGEIVTIINPTINTNNDITLFNTNINTIMASEVKPEDDLSFIKDVYNSTYGLDLSMLTYDNIKNSIFDNSQLNDDNFIDCYAIKTNDRVDDENIIYKMLIPGAYGGRRLLGNDNDDRESIFLKNSIHSTLEVGDILVAFDTINNKNYAWLFYGFDDTNRLMFYTYDETANQFVDNSYAAYKQDTNIKTGWRILKEAYSYDLFAILRPTRVFGTTVKYEANNNNINDNTLFIAYGTYKNLLTPTKKEGFTITLNYNNDNLSNEIITKEYEFAGWYTDSNLTNKIENNTQLVSTNYHTIYAKWNDFDFQIPIKEITGYFIKGWNTKPNGNGISYTSEEVANMDKDITLYAQWQEIGAYIKGDMNDNGKIDLQDIIILLKGYLNIIDMTAKDRFIGDMNNNGIIGLQDIIALLKLYLKI